MTSENHRLAAILFADIEGYTALMQVNEQKALAALEKFKTTLESQVLQHKGEIIQFYGDGCLVTFASSYDAVACANQLQLLFQTAPVVPVRVGIHAGDVVFKDGNVFGDSVNIASRVESMGVPGSVLVSSNVRNQIKNKPVFELVNLGKFEFKNIQEGMTVFALANEGLVVPQKEALKGKFKIPSSTSTTDKPNTQNRLVTGLIMLATIVGVFFLGRSFLNQGVDGQNELIEIKDEEGKKVRALVPALSSVKSVACFQFENLTGDATQDWLGVAFSHLLGLDLDQRPEFYTYSAYGLNRYYDRQGLASFKIPSMSMQREVAQRSRNDYFTRIAYTFEENQFVFEGHLYSSKDGKSIVAIKTSNADLYAAIDAIKQQISEHIPGAAQELESQVSLPASNLITNVSFG